MKKIFVLTILVCLGLFGCGSENSGLLSVAAPALSNGIVTASAKFTPFNRSVIPGQPIQFRWYTVGVTSKSQTTELTTTEYTNSNGAVSSQYILSPSRTESIVVYVIASTGDITNSEGWQSVLVVP